MTPFLGRSYEVEGPVLVLLGNPRSGFPSQEDFVLTLPDRPPVLGVLASLVSLETWVLGKKATLKVDFLFLLVNVRFFKNGLRKLPKVKS